MTFSMVQSDHPSWSLFLARPDKTYSYTDCISFVLMRRLGLHRALALDADFQQKSLCYCLSRTLLKLLLSRSNWKPRVKGLKAV